MNGTLGHPYRIVYNARDNRTLLGDVIAYVVKPNGVTEGPFSLIEFANVNFKGLYFFDYLTTLSSLEGEYVARISSVVDGIRTAVSFTLSANDGSDIMAAIGVVNNNVLTSIGLMNEMLARLTTQRAVGLDRLDVPVSSRATQLSVDQVFSQTTAIKHKTDQLAFDSGMVYARAQTVMDKTDYQLLPAERNFIADTTWDETAAAHVMAGTAGQRLESIYNKVWTAPDYTPVVSLVWDAIMSPHSTDGTFGKAMQGISNLSFLDVPVSSRASAVEVAPLALENTLVNVGITLGNLLAAQAGSIDMLPTTGELNSALAPISRTSQLNTVEQKIDNLTATKLDAGQVWNYASRALTQAVQVDTTNLATKTDLIPIAKQETLIDTKDYLSTLLQNQQADINNLPTKADLSVALAPIGKTEQLNSISNQVAALESNKLTAAQVWSSPTRSLTEAVEVDTSNLATKADLANTANSLVISLSNWQAKGSLTVNPATDVLDVMAQLTRNGMTVTDADSASVELRDTSDTVIFALGPDAARSSPSGVFQFSRASASGVLQKNRNYFLKAMITRGAETYTGITSVSTY